MFDFFFIIIDNKDIKLLKDKFFKWTKEELKKMYMFNRITVNPQLPKRINRLTEIANNLWWSWNSEYLRLLKDIDIDLWESVR